MERCARREFDWWPTGPAPAAGIHPIFTFDLQKPNVADPEAVAASRANVRDNRFPLVSAKAVRISGGLQSDVAVPEARLSSLQWCYSNYFNAEGTVTVGFDVNEHGRLAGQVAFDDDKLSCEGLLYCIEQQVSRLRFPASDAPSRFELDLTFEHPERL